MAYLQADKNLNWNGVKGYQYFLKDHNSNDIDIPTEKRKKTVGVTVHNTPEISVSSETTMAEQYTRATRNGAMNDVVVHIYVDDKCFWHCHPLELVSWHSGDGTSDPNSGNNTTISIEIIGESAKAETNAVKLVAYLMKKYNWTVEKNLYTHNYWISRERGITGSMDYMNTAKGGYKWCPAYILGHWSDFKKSIQKYMKSDESGGDTPKPADSSKEVYRVRKSWDDAKSQIGAFNSLENAKKACKSGYTVYNSSGKAVYTSPLKSVDEIAREVIIGKWDSGAARKQKLTEAGYNYDEVQNRVNEILYE